MRTARTAAFDNEEDETRRHSVSSLDSRIRRQSAVVIQMTKEVCPISYDAFNCMFHSVCKEMHVYAQDVVWYVYAYSVLDLKTVQVPLGEDEEEGNVSKVLTRIEKEHPLKEPLMAKKAQIKGWFFQEVEKLMWNKGIQYIAFIVIFLYLFVRGFNVYMHATLAREKGVLKLVVWL